MTRYIDGDKLQIEVDGDDETVHLIGAYAPEIAKRECVAYAALARVAELIPFQMVPLDENTSQAQATVFIETGTTDGFAVVATAR